MADLQSAQMPFDIVGRPFSQLNERERCFFIGDEYLPLPDNHVAQLILLDRESSRRVKLFAAAGLFQDHDGDDLTRFPLVDHKLLHDKWNADSDIQDVRQWLHDLGIPYSRDVFLWYDQSVVFTSWKIVARYWDAFTWSVGMVMHAFDHTLSWVCEFHHEDVISFYTFPKAPDT